MHSNLCFCLWALSILSLSLSSCPCGPFGRGRLILPAPCHLQLGPNLSQVSLLSTPRRCDFFITGASRRADNYYSRSPNLPLFRSGCFRIYSYEQTYTYPSGQVSIKYYTLNSVSHFDKHYYYYAGRFGNCDCKSLLDLHL